MYKKVILSLCRFKTPKLHEKGPSAISWRRLQPKLLLRVRPSAHRSTTPTSGEEEIALFSGCYSDYSVFDEMPLGDVIWDEEYGHHDFLDQLAPDAYYLAAKRTPYDSVPMNLFNDVAVSAPKYDDLTNVRQAKGIVHSHGPLPCSHPWPCRGRLLLVTWLWFAMVGGDGDREHQQ
jgi:hypothetical protein